MEQKNNSQDGAKAKHSKPKATEPSSISDDSTTDTQDLINSINYNTITSLAALKDILQGDSTSTLQTDDFFQHYFMNHCNNLSNENSVSLFPFPEKRRLSQCKEEDEDSEKKHSESASTSETKHTSHKSQQNKVKDVLKTPTEEVEISALEEPTDNEESQNKTVMGVHHKFIVSPIQAKEHTTEKTSPIPQHNAHTVYFGTKGVEQTRPNVKTIFDPLNLRRDKKYFDSSLIEIRSKVDDLDTTPEDIWVKRNDPKPNPVKRVVRVSKDAIPESKEIQAKGVSKHRRISLDDGGRARASSWSSRKDGFIRMLSLEKKDKKKKSKDDDDGIIGSSHSVTDKATWGSADDVGSPMYQQTIHGTSGVSRRPALFQNWRSKRGETRRHPSLMQQVFGRVQNIGKSSERKESVHDNKNDSPAHSPSGSDGKNTGKSSDKKETSSQNKKESSKDYKPTTKDGSAHPHAGSDAHYYHTMTAAAQRRPSSAIAKVVDIFRSRPNSSNEAADKRKASEQMSYGLLRPTLKPSPRPAVLMQDEDSTLVY